MDQFIDDNDRLKQCPFCGAEAEIITFEIDAPSMGAQCVQCTNPSCGATSGLIYPLMDDVTDLLSERWNKRCGEHTEEDPRGKTTDATHGAPQATASPQAPVASTSPITSHPYFVEINDYCKTCGNGRTWNVIRPDGSSLSTYWDDIEDAQEIADQMNEAYLCGLAPTAVERPSEDRDAHAEKCVKACAGLPAGALDGGWTASGIIAYAKSLEDLLTDLRKTLKDR